MVEEKINQTAVSLAYGDGNCGTARSRKGRREGSRFTFSDGGLGGQPAGKSDTKKQRQRLGLQRGISRKTLWKTSHGIGAQPEMFLLYSAVTSTELCQIIGQAVAMQEEGPASAWRPRWKNPAA
jgi:hypothetical protein